VLLIGIKECDNLIVADWSV